MQLCHIKGEEKDLQPVLSKILLISLCASKNRVLYFHSSRLHFWEEAPSRNVARNDWKPLQWNCAGCSPCSLYVHAKAGCQIWFNCKNTSLQSSLTGLHVGGLVLWLNGTIHFVESYLALFRLVEILALLDVHRCEAFSGPTDCWHVKICLLSCYSTLRQL